MVILKFIFGATVSIIMYAIVLVAILLKGLYMFLTWIVEQLLKLLDKLCGELKKVEETDEVPTE